jgi:hypothetical protein
MKKISLYMMALLTTVLTACNEDYSTSVPAQSNPQESALQSSSVTYSSASVSTIDLQSRSKDGIIIDDSPITLGTVTVAEGAMPANTIMKAKVDVSEKSDFSEYFTIEAESMANSNEVNILPSVLQAAYYNSFTHDPNTTTVYLRISLYTLTNGTSEAMVGNPKSADFYKSNPVVSFTPVNEKGIYIAENYYAVIKDLEGKWTIEKKFNHSEEDVYDDPVFTATIDALKNDAGVRFDTEYYIVAEEDLAAFKAGDLTLGYGKGEGENIQMAGPAFVGPATDGAAKYNLTLNMEKQAIVIEPEIHFYCYFLYANSAKKMNPAEGETSRNYMFYKSDETTFTYTTMWPNDDNGKSVYNVKVWERKDMLANLATNTWGFDGTARGTRKEQGNFAQPGQWLGPLTEGWYTFTITMDEENNKHSYKWTSIPAPTTTYTNISIIGTINGSSWDKDYELKQCASAPHNWYLLDFELTADAKLKFRANKNWETKDWGGDGSQPISPVVYTLPKGSSDISVPAGKYDFYLNDITGDWTILKTVE